MHSSLVTFSQSYDVVRDGRIAVRERTKKAQIDALSRLSDDDRDALRKAERDAKIARSVDIQQAYHAVSAGDPTQEQRDLVCKTDDTNRHLLRMRGEQTAEERIYTVGHFYPGSHIAGPVGGKAIQGPKRTFGLLSEGDPIRKRFIASCGKPKRRNKTTGEVPKTALRAGPSKDKMWRQMQPLVAHDEVNVQFSVNCVDFWRHDKDTPPGKKWLFDSEEAMVAHYFNEYAEGRLGVLPTFAVHTPDDRYPGRVVSAHVYCMLPDDGIKEAGHGSSGVWEGQKLQHAMLEQVQAKLNEQLGADPGGLSNMYQGKHPCCPQNRYVPINVSHLMTLGEMFEALDCGGGPGRYEMAHRQGRQRLQGLGLDPEASNSFFTVTSEEGLYAVRAAYKADRKIYGKQAHGERAFDLAWLKIQAHIATCGKDLPYEAIETLEGLLHGAIAWALVDFDPSRVNRAPYNPGAAAHLILPTDDEATRQRKGQTVSAESKRRHSRRLIADAKAAIEAEGGELTISELARRTGLARDTVRNNLTAAVVEATANEMLAVVRSVNETTAPSSGVAVQSGVWGVSLSGSIEIKLSSQPEIVIQSVQHPDDLPISWRPIDWDGFRDRKLREYAHGVRSGRIDSSKPRRRTTGANLVDFLTGGPVRRYAAPEGRSQRRVIQKSGPNLIHPTSVADRHASRR
ncbi:hypothetical protein [Tardiphaga sp. 813_E8_N1_3]|uniref:hypothetical protein n=1 Tax=Tardiphaga sp. 813_E8_N1_3 TaxID=3240760 RepID=UPI003F2685D0